MNAAEVQQKPAGTGRKILDMVIQDLNDRAEFGFKKYGEYLTSHNGRNALLDAYQEALDLCMYLRQALDEQEKTERVSSSKIALENQSFCPPGFFMSLSPDNFETPEEYNRFILEYKNPNTTFKMKPGFFRQSPYYQKLMKTEVPFDVKQVRVLAQRLKREKGVLPLEYYEIRFEDRMFLIPTSSLQSILEVIVSVPGAEDIPS